MVVANLPQIVSDTWVKVSWDQFREIADHCDYPQGRFYYL